MRVLVNYATPNHFRCQRASSRTGLKKGGIDRVISYKPEDIDPSYFAKHRKILSQKRGAGYFLWKPYLIQKTLTSLKDGDYLFYADSVCYFINSIDYLIRAAEKYEQSVLLFQTGYLEKRWTKRDAFVLLNCDEPEFTDTTHREASFSLWKKSKSAIDFVEEYLHFCEDERILTDMPNTMGLPNYPEFEDHRHDQSILSLLSKKRNMPAFRAPSQYGNKWIDEYPNSTYPQILIHRDVPLKEKIIRRIIRLKNRFSGRATVLR